MGEKTNEDAVAGAGILCDVRDVASVHVSALLTEEAGGHRFGVSTCEFLRHTQGYRNSLQLSSSRPLQQPDATGPFTR